MYLVHVTVKVFFVLSFQIPEYCKVVEESEILSQAFPLIFAFDEIIALGYRENVNLAQIRTFTEMDSHEEKVFQAIRQVKLCIGIKIVCWYSLSSITKNLLASNFISPC